VGIETRVRVHSDSDVVSARLTARELAAEAGISGSDLTVVATAVSEIARNIISYADHGEIVFTIVQKEGRAGLRMVATDHGPGIADIDLAMRDGYSTAKSLGFGLPGAKRLVDEFEIESEAGRGTTVVMTKWRR